MEITDRWLEKHGACSFGLEWIATEKKRDEIYIIKKLIELDLFGWANWYISRRLNRIRKVRYAIYAAEQVINIYEDKYPDDPVPRNAITAAKRYIKNPCKQTKAYAYAASSAAYVVYDPYNTYFTYAYFSSYKAAVNTAALAASTSASYYACCTADAAAAADAKTKTKIINYGIKLIKEMA